MDSAHRRRRVTPRAIGVVAVAAIAVIATLCCGTAAFLSRRDYGTFAFWSLPQRINYCGRRYYPEDARLGSGRQFTSQDSGGTGRWTLTSRSFTLRPIYAVETRRTDLSRICTTVLYIPLGGQNWEPYVLSGGP